MNAPHTAVDKRRANDAETRAVYAMLANVAHVGTVVIADDEPYLAAPSDPKFLLRLLRQCAFRHDARRAGFVDSCLADFAESHNADNPHGACDALEIAALAHWVTGSRENRRRARADARGGALYFLVDIADNETQFRFAALSATEVAQMQRSLCGGLSS